MDEVDDGILKLFFELADRVMTRKRWPADLEELTIHRHRRSGARGQARRAGMTEPAPHNMR